MRVGGVFEVAEIDHEAHALAPVDRRVDIPVDWPLNAAFDGDVLEDRQHRRAQPQSCRLALRDEQPLALYSSGMFSGQLREASIVPMVDVPPEGRRAVP